MKRYLLIIVMKTVFFIRQAASLDLTQFVAVVQKYSNSNFGQMICIPLDSLLSPASDGVNIRL